MSVLLIDLDDLKAGSFSASGSFRSASLELDPDSAFRFSGQIKLSVRINTTDKLTYYVSGRLNYQAQGECRRCLREVNEPVETEFRGVFAFPEALEKLAPTREEQAAEEIFPLKHGETNIDLTALVRESLLLEYPLYVQCAEDCRGFCPSCGANLNVESCKCRNLVRDARWAKLLDLNRDK